VLGGVVGEVGAAAAAAAASLHIPQLNQIHVSFW